MPKKTSKPKIVGHRAPRSRSVMLPDSLAGLRGDFEEFREATEKRISDLEEKVRDLRDSVEERERNGEL
jgi:hypothetical protein